MGSVQRSFRIRPAIRRVAFSNRVGGSFVVMRASFERGVELPEAEAEERGTGRALTWDGEGTGSASGSALA